MKEHCAALIEGPSERAIDILMVFSEDKPVWSRGEIAEHFGMPRSTTYCYLTSLRSYALIVEDRHGGYRLAPRIFPLAAVAKGRCVDHDDRDATPRRAQPKVSKAVTRYERVGHHKIEGASDVLNAPTQFSNFLSTKKWVSCSADGSEAPVAARFVIHF